MITFKDMFKAVCQRIRDETNINILDGDVDEPILRPAFRVFMDTGETCLYSAYIRQKEVFFNIYFYAKEKDKGAIMDIQDKLVNAFTEPLKIKEECSVYIDTLDFEKVEKDILNLSFDFSIGTKWLDESALEPMDKIFINNIKLDVIKEVNEHGNSTKG